MVDTKNTGSRNVILDNDLTVGGSAGFNYIVGSTNVGAFTSAGAWTLGPVAGTVAHVIQGTLSFNTTETTQAVNGLRRSATNTLAISTNSIDRITIDTNTVTSTLIYQGPNGTVALPTYGFTGTSSNTGMYLAASDDIGFTTNGVNAGIIDSNAKWTIGRATGDNSHLIYGNTVEIRATTGTGATLLLTENGAVSAFLNINDAGTISTWHGDSAVALSFAPGNATAGSISTTGAWTIGPVAAGATIEHNIYGHIHLGTSAATIVPNSAFWRFVGNKKNSIMFTDSASTGLLELNSNIYSTDGSNLRYAILDTGGSRLTLAAGVTLSDIAYYFRVANNFSHAADSAAAITDIALGTYDGLWTLGRSTGTNGPGHTLKMNGIVNVTLLSNTGTNQRLDFKDGSTIRWEFESQASTGTLAFFQGGSTNVGSITNTGLWTLGPAAAGVTHVIRGGMTVTGTVSPSADNTYDLGTASLKWRDLHLSGASLKMYNGANVASIVASPTTTRTLTLPDATDTLMGKATSDIMTNKTVSAGTLTGTTTNSGTISGGTMSGATLSGTTTNSGTISGGTVSATTLSGSGGGITNLNMDNAASGILAVTRGGTGAATATGGGAVVKDSGPTISNLIVNSSLNVNGPAEFDGGLFLPSTGATASDLNFYATQSFSPVTFTAANSGNSNTTTVVFTRIGNVVTMRIAAISVATNGSDAALNTSAGIIPTWALPATATRMVLELNVNGTLSAGHIILNTGGSITIGTFVGPFGGTSAGIGNAIGVSYLV